MDPRSCWWHWSLQRELPARVPVFAFALAFGYLSGDWHPGALARGTAMMVPRSFEFELGQETRASEFRSYTGGGKFGGEVAL